MRVRRFNGAQDGPRRGDGSSTPRPPRRAIVGGYATLHGDEAHGQLDLPFHGDEEDASDATEPLRRPGRLPFCSRPDDLFERAGLTEDEVFVVKALANGSKQRDMADALGVTDGRVSQILTAADAKLSRYCGRLVRLRATARGLRHESRAGQRRPRGEG